MIVYSRNSSHSSRSANLTSFAVYAGRLTRRKFGFRGNRMRAGRLPAFSPRARPETGLRRLGLAAAAAQTKPAPIQLPTADRRPVAATDRRHGSRICNPEPERRARSSRQLQTIQLQQPVSAEELIRDCPARSPISARRSTTAPTARPMSTCAASARTATSSCSTASASSPTASPRSSTSTTSRRP